MLIVTGTALVLVTWTLCLAGLIVVGLPLAAAARSGPLGVQDLRRGLWWGLLAVTVLAYLLNLRWPLAAGAVAGVLLAVVVVGTVLSAVLMGRRGWRAGLRTGPSTVVMRVALGAAVLYLAVAALGPVTNYDSGLYHLGAIRYAADYATIPGLANLYFPFGYGNAEFPLAALLGNGPWGVEGFRLLNGLVIAGLCLDLALRSTRRRLDPGQLVLAGGALTVLVPMVGLSDYWVTSPSQDSAVFAATVVASAYVVDAVRGGRAWVADAATASALTILLVTLRPTMVAYAAVVAAVLVGLRVHRRHDGSPRFAVAAFSVAGAGILAAVAATARDFVLSGWLQYPLSILAFDVPWRASDPAPERIATLGFHRDPTDIYRAAEGWGWVLPWFSRLPQQWETAVLAGLVLALIGIIVVAVRLRVNTRWRGMMLATAPSILMTAAWWVASPPSFRFAWGPVFTSLTIPIGWLVWRVLTGVPRPQRIRWTRGIAVVFAAPVCVVVAFSAVTRLDVGSIDGARTWDAGIRIPYAVADVRQVEVVESTLPGGLTVVLPTDSEQCWSAFPLCTPRIASSVRLRGDSLAEGLLP